MADLLEQFRDELAVELGRAPSPQLMGQARALVYDAMDRAAARVREDDTPLCITLERD